MKLKTNYPFPDEYRNEAEAYIDYKRSLGFKYGYDDQKKCNQLLRFLYANAPDNNVTCLTKELVEAYLNQFKDLRPRTIHINQSLVRQYGIFLSQRGFDSYIYPDVLIQCPRDFSPYIFSKEEMYSIFRCADNIGHNRYMYINSPFVYPAVLRMLYACGSRISETLMLKEDDVDLSEGLLTFYNGKNNVSRIIPMSDSLTFYLKKYTTKVDRTNNDYFFPAPHGECYSPITIRNIFRKLLCEAKIAKLPEGQYPRIHDLRHTFAVHALEQSIEYGLDPYCSLPALSSYMGHKGIESTEYYLRLTKHYFINTLSYTQYQADIIFPEV